MSRSNWMMKRRTKASQLGTLWPGKLIPQTWNDKHPPPFPFLLFNWNAIHIDAVEQNSSFPIHSQQHLCNTPRFKPNLLDSWLDCREEKNWKFNPTHLWNSACSKVHQSKGHLAHQAASPRDIWPSAKFGTFLPHVIQAFCLAEWVDDRWMVLATTCCILILLLQSFEGKLAKNLRVTKKITSEW